MALRELPQVEVVAAAFTGPYANSSWGSGTRLAGGRKVDYGVNSVTDDYRELFKIPLVAGRWFSREDDAATWTPVRDQPAPGARDLRRRQPRSARSSRRSVTRTSRRPTRTTSREVKRVIGVVEEFRQDGELSTPENYLFYRMRLDAAGPEGGAARAHPRPPGAGHAGGLRGNAGQARAWRWPATGRSRSQPLDAMRDDKLREYTHAARWSSARSPASCC